MPAKKKTEETPGPVLAPIPQDKAIDVETQAGSLLEGSALPDTPKPDESATPGPEPEQITLKLEPGQVIYAVTGNITSLAHAGKSYPVMNGKVILLATDRWYDDLIQAGILKFI